MKKSKQDSITITQNGELVKAKENTNSYDDSLETFSFVYEDEYLDDASNAYFGDEEVMDEMYNGQCCDNNNNDILITNFNFKCKSVNPFVDRNIIHYSFFNYGGNFSVYVTKLIEFERCCIIVYMFDNNIDHNKINVSMTESATVRYKIDYESFFLLEVSDNNEWYQEKRMKIINELINKPLAFTVPANRFNAFFYHAHNHGNIAVITNPEMAPNYRLSVYYQNYKNENFKKMYLLRYFSGEQSDDIVKIRLVIYVSEIVTIMNEKNAFADRCGSICITRFIAADVLETSFFNNDYKEANLKWYSSINLQHLRDLLFSSFKDWRAHMFFTDNHIYLVYINPILVKIILNDYEDLFPLLFTNIFSNKKNDDVSEGFLDSLKEFKLKDVSINQNEDISIKDKKVLDQTLFVINKLHTQGSNKILTKEIQFYKNKNNKKILPYNLSNIIKDMHVNDIL